MALDDAFQAGTDAALADMVQRPTAPKPQAPRFSMWGTLTAAPIRGTIAGLVAQNLGSTADVLGAFGSVLGATPASGGGMFATQTPDERKQTLEAADRLRTSGPDYMSDGGRSFRNVAADYMPDPVTAHASEVAVANLFRVGSKAIAAAALLGPVAGAAVSGAEEGFTAADELAQKGVDLDTRTAVGALTAGVQAATFALPVAGQTWKQTTALALGGGPVAFVGQQAATREILQRADYSKLAEQYDPFDPVGLTLSTILPLGFGAMAMRGTRGRAAEVPPVERVDDEAVDAARTSLLADQVAVTRPVDPADLQANAQHEQAYSRALDQMASGQRVEVSDIAPMAGAERIRADMETALAPVARAIEEDAAARVEAAPVVMPEPVKPAEPAPEANTAEGAGAQKLPSESPELDARVAEIEASAPTMMVQLEGMDAPAPLAEVMARIRQEVADDLAEAPLIEAAANCYIRNL